MYAARMEHISDLPCPRCGSTTTLDSLMKKREEVRTRIERGRRRRYKPKPPPSVSGVGSLFGAGAIGILGATNTISGGNITMSSGAGSMLYNASTSKLTVSAPDPNDMSGCVVINGASLDMCVDCGTIYSSNIKRVGEAIVEETVRMDPLGALAEIRDA